MKWPLKWVQFPDVEGYWWISNPLFSEYPNVFRSQLRIRYLTKQDINDIKEQKKAPTLFMWANLTEPAPPKRQK